MLLGFVIFLLTCTRKVAILKLEDSPEQTYDFSLYEWQFRANMWPEDSNDKGRQGTDETESLEQDVVHI